MSDLNAKWLELVAAGKAEWVPRMVDQTGWTYDHHPAHRERFRDEAVPNWDDPATRGALVGQVEARYGGPVSVWYREDGTCALRVGRFRVWAGLTKAEVLLRALEAAP